MQGKTKMERKISPSFTPPYLTLQFMNLDDIKRKVQVQSERNIMVFRFSENDGSNIKKYEQQGVHMSTSVSKKN